MKQMWVLALFLGATLACQQVYDIGSANFYVTYKDSACDNFTFVKCQWKTCTSYSYYYVNGVMFSSCARQQTQFNTDWGFCTQKYCDDSVDYLQNTQSIQQCKASIASKSKIIGIIFLSVIGAIVVGVLIAFLWSWVTQRSCCSSGSCANCRQKICACVCYVFKCECLRRATSRQVQPEPIVQPSNEQNPLSREANQPPKLKEQNQIQSQSEGNQRHLTDIKTELKQTSQGEWKNLSCESTKESICKVCKGDHSTLQLNCGHRYHPQCAWEKILMAEKCLFCSSWDIETIRLYCSECFKRYLEMKISYLQEKSSDKLICNECLNSAAG